MTRRKRRAVVAAVVLLMVALGFARLLPASGARVTRENYERITPGMSRSEVFTILGPPGDYRTGPTARWSQTISIDYGPNEYEAATKKTEEEARIAALLRWESWKCDAVEINVGFGSLGVVQRHFLSATKRDQSWLENLDWRVKHQWEKWFPPERSF